tara:strand:- start:99 stop:398 length:300 start_codon:yes stop_codon:yes gene_type:complete
MNSGKRYLMFLKKEGSGIVVEATNSSHWEEIKQEAESKGMSCLTLSIENFYPDYRGYRYFDLRNTVTLKTFSIDYVLHAWEMDKKHQDGHEGTDEWFIH